MPCVEYFTKSLESSLSFWNSLFGAKEASKAQARHRKVERMTSIDFGIFFFNSDDGGIASNYAMHDSLSSIKEKSSTSAESTADLGRDR